MSLFVRFNENQYQKVNDYLKKIINEYLKIIDIFHFHQMSLKKMKEIFKSPKIKHDNIVGKSIRSVYFDIIKKMFYELKKHIYEITSIEHINLFVKIGIGQYIEKNFIDLPQIEIFQNDETMEINIGKGEDDNIYLSKKIKSKNDNIYKVKDGKKYSTNQFAKNVIKESIESITKIKELLNLIVNDLETSKSALFE